VNIDEPITIEPYNPAWVTDFAGERAVLCHALSIEPSRVEHIGSTSVVGMQAKPIVDMMLGLDSFPLMPTVSDRLHSLGYEALGEAGVPGRLYFRKRRPNAFNVQAVLFGSPLWTDNVLLRDFLITHPVEARRYADKNVGPITLATGHSSLTPRRKLQSWRSCWRPRNNGAKPPKQSRRVLKAGLEHSPQHFGCLNDY
jgi:GrpB-like predicted nucleotidyltransferase (UPF0157 family)